MRTIKVGVASATLMFNLDGLDYKISDWTIFYGNVEKDSGGTIVSKVKVGIISKYGGNHILAHPIDYDRWENGVGTPYATLNALISDLVTLLGFNTGGLTPLSTGFINYEDTSTTSVPIILVANTWTDLPNNGSGGQTLKTFAPFGVSELMDVNNGYLDATELTDGSEIEVRTEFSVSPDINNALLQFRILAGTGAGTFDLENSLGRLDDGSGKYYAQTVIEKVFANGAIVLDIPLKLQINL